MQPIGSASPALAGFRAPFLPFGRARNFVFSRKFLNLGQQGTDAQNQPAGDSRRLFDGFENAAEHDQLMSVIKFSWRSACNNTSELRGGLFGVCCES